MNYSKTYPKEFKNERILIEKSKCFLIMPFSDEFNMLYGILRGALLDKGYMPVRVDFVPGSISIMNKIMNQILSAQYVIVDISNLNPNVFYELGIVHCYKDARNIILIKDKTTNAPSDIRHINYIEYDRDNLTLLKEQVLTTLNSVRYISELESSLVLNKIISVQENSDNTVEILGKMFDKNQIILLSKILNKEFNYNDTAEIEAMVDKFISNIIGFDIEKNVDAKQLNIISKLFINILLCCSECNFISDKITLLLYTKELYEQANDTLKFRTNLALTFAVNGRLINVVVPWILEYFSRSKSTHIDLNRYQIEAMLLSTHNDDINNAIINAVFSSDRHIREHMADIIGEKRLFIARNNLVIQLNREENLYAAASIMEALGKVGQLEDISIVLKWVESHYNEICNPGGNFVFKHARNSLASLDCTTQRTYLEEFMSKYKNDFWNE